MSEVSIVIPNYNGKAYLKDCLDSLLCQTAEDLDIVVVDNGSSDGSVPYVKEEYPGVRILELGKNYGFCRAVNEGIQASDAPYVILLNNDTKAEPGFVQELLLGIQRHPGAFSCASRMVKMREPAKLDDGGDYYCALGWVFAYGKDKPVEYYLQERRIFSACAGAAIYRREVFDVIGYFDERHFAYLEDLDMGYRAKIFGYENWFLPKAVVHHVGSGTSGSRYNAFKVSHSSRNNIYVIYKNMPLLQIVLNLPFLAVGFAAKQVFFARRGFGREYFKGIFKGFGMAERGRKVRFQKKNFGNYCKIQLELWANLLKLLRKP